MTLTAELYTLTHRGNRGDLGFYRRVCRGASSVLELGCGAGRVLSALRAPGRELVGLDRDPGLLRLARAALRSDAELVRGDMRRFALGRRFQRIVLPYSGFYCLLTRADALACLRSVRRHLADDGRFVFDAYAADAFHELGAPGEQLDWRFALRHRGRTYDVYEQSRWFRSRQRLDVRYLYHPRGGTRRAAFELPQRYWLASQLGPLLAQAGLVLESLHGDFRGGRYSPASSELMVVSARPR